MTDKRFAMLDGLWYLREHHTSDKVIHKINDDDEEVTEIDEETNDYDDEEEEEDSFDAENTDDDYESDDDDLADLVVIDEDEMEEDIN